MGWGGEPDRAVDQRQAATAWGASSCTHTDAGAETKMDSGVAHKPAWWQVDLGAVATIDRINVWHRTDCCQDRLATAAVVISTHPDYLTGQACGQLSDWTSAPEVSLCHGKKGRYVTVTHDVHISRGGYSVGVGDTTGGTSKVRKTPRWPRSWQPQPFIAIFPQEYMGQLASSGPT